MEASNSTTKYIVHFADGGAGRRERGRPLAIGDEITDGGTIYRISRVEQPQSANGLGQAWSDVSET
jgi:hypothetical protein